MKIDLKRDLKHLYSPSAKAAEMVEVPPLQYLMIDGSGDPNTAQAYKDSVSALYSVAYTLKFAFKKGEGIEYPVMPLEGLWWTEDPAAFSMEDKSNWLWTMLILQPEVVTAEAFERAIAEVRKKKNPPLLDDVRLETYNEGLSAQIMHIGPYADEAPTVARLNEFIETSGYVYAAKHHEIYLSDPTRAKPETMKTIIRHPVTAKAI